MPSDPRQIGAYGISEAARYLSLPPATLQSWVRGRAYATVDGSRFSDPLVQLPDATEPLLSFTNLAEAHVLKAIRRQHRLPMQQIRPALSYLEDELGVSHPLAHQELLTDGVSLFVERFGQLVNLSRQGQLAIRESARVRTWFAARLGERLAEAHGNRTHPRRRSRRRTTVLKTAGGTSPRALPPMDCSPRAGVSESEGAMVLPGLGATEQPGS